ncbi:MAG: DUF262 domain-containing HNH endonuclease family protein [Gammaproteobacteria bacterium]|nr:DUF262 domain-containing HNH endonuclease family protein [Gammaproteobacteria bacterium]
MNSPASNAKDDHRNTVGEWLKRQVVWRIPVYQRHYAWDSEIESGPVHLFWETVKEQTVARLNGQELSQHYLGAVLVDDKTERGATDDIKRWDVVDGQQRLTTIQIALLALIRVAADEYSCGDQIKEDLVEFVFSDKAHNLPRLVPTNFDKQQFEKVLFDVYDVLPDVGSPQVSRENANKSKIVSTFEFFKGVYKSLVEGYSRNEIDVILEIKKSLLYGFDIVLIALRETDEAQKIFESLNNYAKPLTTFDLIRNNLFDRAAKCHPGMDVKLFWSPDWQQIEKPYWEGKADDRKTGGSTHIEAYIARMMVAKMRKEIRFNRNDIFRTYKEFHKEFSSIDEEIKGLVDYVDIYRYLDGDTKKNPVDTDVDFGVFRYEIWKARDFYPVTFLIAGSSASALQKQRMIRLLECYVIRRGVCRLSYGHYNLHAITICKELGDNPNYETLSKVLKTATKNTTVFPDDERVKADCPSAKFYPSPFQRYVFDRIEESMHDKKTERTKLSDLTIDHILPKKWDGNEKWKSIVLGTNANHSEVDVMVVNSHIDTIGNLTLMSGPNNSAKSNRPLDEVKELLGETTVKLNRQLAEEESWGPEKIHARSKWLAEKICEIWPYDIPDENAQ